MMEFGGFVLSARGSLIGDAQQQLVITANQEWVPWLIGLLNL